MHNVMTALKLIGLILFVVSCAATDGDINKPLDKDSKGIFVANYSDFGPPQLASKLIGHQWWQWDDPDNHKPVRYNVKVVVFRNIDIERVKKAFPVIPKLKQDYRYVQYEVARSYFEQRLKEFEEEMRSYDDPCDIGTMYIYPLELYKTALAMEKKLRK